VRCEHLHDSGPYVLGALSPTERDTYERHFADCAVCRAEVAELAALPGLMGRLDLATAQAIASGGPDAMHAVLEAMPVVDASAPWAAPTDWAGPTATPADPEPEPVSDEKLDPLLPRVLDRAKAQRRTERRRKRLQLATTALVAACLGVLAVVGVRAADFGTDRPELVAMTSLVPNPPVTASIALEPYEGGTRIYMQCRYRTGTGDGEWAFRMVVIPKSGEPQDVSTWTAGFGDEYDVRDHTKFNKSDIARIEIQSNATGRTLLVYSVTP
jgi:hypothetical protein